MVATSGGPRGEGEADVMNRDADGMLRADMEWTIEGRGGVVASGKLYGLHAGELEEAKRAIKLRARRGDTITTRIS